MSSYTSSKAVSIAYVVGLVLVLLNAMAFLVPATEQFVDLFTRPNEKSLVEFSEAILWFTCFLGFGWLAINEFRKSGVNFRVVYFLFFSLLYFMVCGEEISWGQHLGFIEASESMKEINSQGEFNLHNLNMNLILGVSESSFMYPYLTNIGQLVSPLFQMFTLFVWGILPLALTRWFAHRNLPEFILQYPLPSKPISVFVLVCFLIYLLVDKLVLDVAIVFELCIAMTSFMVMFEQYKSGGRFVAQLKSKKS